MKGWVTKRLGEICDIKHGFAFKSEFFANEGKFVLLTPGNYYETGGYRDRGEKQKYYTGQIPSEYIMEEGDMLVVMTEQAAGLLGSPLLVPESGKFLHNQRLGLVVPKPDIPWCREFFFHLFNTKGVRKGIHDSASGVKVRHTSPTKIGEVEVSFPTSLAEQQRIVGVLEEAFEGLATARATAEKNLQNARALFESHLQSVFTEQWQNGELVRLSDLATDITDGDHLPPPKSPIGVPFITIGNILKETREIDFSDTFMVPRAYFDALKPYKKPRKGDVLYTVTGSYGIPVIVRDDREFCFQRHIGLVRPTPQTSSDWLYYLLMSPQLLKQARDGATGTAQKTVSLKVLRSFTVPKISLKQQKQAVEKLDALSAETQRLTSLYERKLAALEALKKSLLHQAFAGEL